MTADPTKSIPTFYSGQSIFLTGGTGFLGKVFIEKVLRSCPDIREIFLLMRPRKGLNIQERLDEMLKLPLYEKLRNEQASSFKKLIPISGDASEKELGLSSTDKQMLTERVTIIIHCAANVKMNDNLKYALFANTRATRDICILAESMKNLIALVYISTAFTNVNIPFIEEKVYPFVADWQKMIKMAESLDEHTLNIFTAKCLGYVPNTYAFSKNLSESIIQEYSSSLPCAIVRPSMVIPSLKEPMPGWIDNIYGTIGITIGSGKGLIRVTYCNKFANQDVVPVDIVIKAIIVVTWKIGLSTFMTDCTPFVLNCTNQKNMTFQNVTEMLLSVNPEVPLEGIVWTPHAILTDNFILFYILTMLLHILPAMIIDPILYFSGHRPMLIRMQRQIYIVGGYIMCYFVLREWKFSNTNSLALISSIPSDNQDMFSFDFSYADVRKYLKNCTIGAKQFLLHEDMNRLDVAREHYKRVNLFVIIVKTIISTGIVLIYKSIYSYTLKYKFSNSSMFSKL